MPRTIENSLADEFALRGASLHRIEFDNLPGLHAEGFSESWVAFRRSCSALAEEAAPLRPAQPHSEELKQALRRFAQMPIAKSNDDALRLFREEFAAFQVSPEKPTFFTGYYEPVVQGSLSRTPTFCEPLLSRPPNLDRHAPGDAHAKLDQNYDSRIHPPYPTRAEIERGALGDLARPLVWVRDGIEAFLIHVQGSARVVLQDGSLLRLTYSGRNGRRYTSIGAILIQEGLVAPEEMSLARLKSWVRANGQGPQDIGRALMQRNESFIFFEANRSLDPEEGPIGGASLALTPLRSIAVDRGIWPYGLPYWLSANLPWLSSSPSPFQRMVVGQDTGSAIIGPARADIFFGSGPEAGERAGDIRHSGSMFVLVPGRAI